MDINEVEKDYNSNRYVYLYEGDVHINELSV